MDVPHQPTLGGYRLKVLLAEGPVTRTWLAEQPSIRREVLIDELRQEAEAAREDFLADIRAKAAVDHPLIGPIFEAVADEACFFVREQLTGRTLSDRLERSETLDPLILSTLLVKIADANLHLETKNLSSAPLDPDYIHLDDNGLVRLVNLVVHGARTPEQSEQDVVALGAALEPLVNRQAPGSTRMLTLLEWMRGEGQERPLSWWQVQTFASQIEQSFEAASTDLVTDGKSSNRNKAIAAGLVIGAGLLVLVGLGIPKSQPEAEPTAPKLPLPEAVLIPAGSYSTPDGGQVDLPAYRISAHEITIGEYAEFLDTLALLTDRRKAIFDHPEQPPEKRDHFPTDWGNLYPAAKAGSTWQTQPVTLDSPVIGVDWWDATAYCQWRKCSLPTQDQWFAAASYLMDDVSTPRPSKWLPVTASTLDKTPAGMLGMAGSLAEWTDTRSPRPANPLGSAFWVIMGASYQRPDNGALAREWVESRSLRRPDLGFRVVFPAE